jgi:hypothetical protein
MAAAPLAAAPAPHQAGVVAAARLPALLQVAAGAPARCGAGAPRLHG